ncbi:DUF488 domain-containing protein [Amycolatopsis jiangsuensis]|uniref:Uncharacterized protein YeaO (DUF488 family) n=1 Tax=Amycolatopsis jiangsuensis TaxID=1181879 RepID=A0A840IQY6_9PSEU|nr:DUF488 domain-containing protein [Amycolatopsis jiangsuensis]MBB4684243.1 uncharacterized protein YeaO (DUF488 family) [Amycolatopsis jiangsuensis]
MASPDVHVARVYDPPASADGERVLVDRLWPRGLAKDAAALDDWCRDVAPSTELRRWYGHDPARFTEFARRYRTELSEPAAAEALATLRTRASRGRLTLLTATKDPAHSQAEVLAHLLRGKD